MGGARRTRSLYGADNPEDPGCKGKRPYPNRKMARVAIARLRKNPEYSGKPGLLAPYRCKQCGQLHIGHDQRRGGATPPL